MGTGLNFRRKLCVFLDYKNIFHQAKNLRKYNDLPYLFRLKIFSTLYITMTNIPGLLRLSPTFEESVMRVCLLFGLSLIAFVIIPFTASSQLTPYHTEPYFGSDAASFPEPPYPFGEIPVYHFYPETYVADTSETAVMLFDFGSVYIDGEQNVIFQRHRRIKIISPDGFKWGVHEIPYSTRPIRQRVRGIEGVTVKRLESGELISRRLEPGSIMAEQISDDKNKVHITLPALEPGVVIEYRYEIVSENPTQLHYWDYQSSPELKRGSAVEYRYDIISDKPGLVPDWHFQTTIPVLWSEYNLRVPEFLEYAYVASSNRPFHISEANEYSDGTTRFHRGTAYRWVRKDMPAIREEPFTTTINDYVSRITFQLAAWYHPQGLRVEVLDTWENLVNRLSRERELGRQASPRRSIRRLTTSLVDDISDTAERLEKIYDYVRTTMEWNGQYSIFTSDRVDRMHDSKIGNGADIALLLISMLQAADIDAYPVILSTRDHGKIQHLYPIRDQFNHVIAYAEIDGEVFLLDATNPLCPVNVLPYNSLNETGLLIKRDELTWVPIKPTVSYFSNISGVINLDDAGGISSTMHIMQDGYGAISGRRILERAGEVEYIQSLLGSRETTLIVDSLRISGKTDIARSLDTFIKFSSDEYLVIDDELLYLNPKIFGGIDDNPFETGNRTYPVDFAFLRESLITIDIIVPDGYAVAELPRAVNLSLQDDSAQYTRYVTVDDGIISINRRFEINKTVFSTREYRRLRNFFNQVVAMETQQVVLERKDGVTERDGVTGES